MDTMEMPEPPSAVTTAAEGGGDVHRRDAWKKYRIYGVILVAALAAAVLLWRSTGAPDIITVQADDKSAQLEFSSGALPDGVDASQITIARVPGGPDTLAAYELGPDGTAFAEPVTFVATFPFTDEGDLPVLLTLEDGEPVIVSDIEYVLDEAEDTITLRVPLPHFSRYLTLAMFFRMRQFRDSGTHAVGVPFPVHVSVFTERSHSSTLDWGQGERTLVHELLSGPDVNVRWTVRNFIAELTDRDAYQQDHSFDRTDMTLSAEFTCKHAGAELVRTQMRFSYRYRSYDVDDGPARTIPRNESFRISTFSRVQCVRTSVPEPSDGAGAVRSEGTGDVVDVPERAMEIWLKFGNAYFPADQFIIANASSPEEGHVCLDDREALALHYHAKEGDRVYGTRSLSALEPTTLVDYGTDGCGFGFYDGIERVNAEGPVIGD